jgi:hypothetical protein
MTTLPPAYRLSDESPVEMAEAKAIWAVEARTALERVAATYHATITTRELANQIQAQSGITTKKLPHHWIGDVLATVARECHSKDEPLLCALCVLTDGTVGDNYTAAVTETYGEAPADPDMHAAEERLKCYAHFGATMPANGGRAALTRQVAARRSTIARRAREDIQRPICPTCHLALPATGQCDACNM